MVVMVDAVPLVVLLVVYVPQAVLLARWDGAEHRLPNRSVLILTVTVSASLLLHAAVTGAWPALRAAAVTALVCGVLAVLVALVAPPVLGMGDAKCVPVVVLMAAVLGGDVLLSGALLAALLAGAAGLMVGLRSGVGAAVPIGPVLLALPALGVIGAPALRGALGIS